MPLNLADIIDAEIRRLQEIRRIVSDPESAAVLDKLYASTAVGNGHTTTPAPMEKPARTETRVPASQIDAIRQVIAAWDGPFTVGELGDHLRSTNIGGNFTNVAVGRVLQRLAKKYGEIKLIAKSGGGNTPNKYEATMNLKI